MGTLGRWAVCTAIIAALSVGFAAAVADWWLVPVGIVCGQAGILTGMADDWRGERKP